jgi:cyclohexadienyl dehydratase
MAWHMNWARRVVTPVLCVFLSSGAILLASGAAGADTTTDLINERLALMKAVAADKARNDRAITDVAREAVVLDAAARAAARAGLNVDASRVFFALQIEAAKEIQRYWTRRWKGRQIPTMRPLADLRVDITRLGNAVVAALADAAQTPQFHNGQPTISGRIHATGLSRQTASQLLAAARSLGPANPEMTLRRILASGQLRVGTTFDYSPFSYRGADENDHRGADIDLARDLAKTLRVELILIETRWPTLMDDLAMWRFDIGMSGISANLSRQRHAFFSLPYHTGGKAAISRCTDTGRFPDLASIDRPGVRLIVNPGGTNQQFVNANIKQASVRVFDDNIRIFDEIIEGRADLMITDAIEIRLQVGRATFLCATLGTETLTFQQKAYLLQRDPALKMYVDRWLGERLRDGTIAAAIERHLRPDLPAAQ